MAANWPKLPAFDSPDELDRPLPEGWRLDQIENLYEQLPIGKRFDQKSSSAQGHVPVIDQSEAGVIGWHDEEPGVMASESRPVVTFANHTCEMRWMRRSFSVIQNVFPLIGRTGACETGFLYYGTKGRVHLQEYKGHFPDYRRKWIPVPPLAEQRAIAHVLGTLDDKIELNRRMNETLEAMARALFKSWFVDFDPVRAKAEGRDPGLPKPLADLFPARLVDSELGEIPEGWGVRPLRDLTAYLSRGIGPTYLETGGICVLNQKCIRDRRIDFSKARRHDYKKKSGDGRLLQRLDVLVNSTGVGTLGRAAQLWHLPEPTIVDSHVTVLRAASGVDPWFLGVGLTWRENEIEALGEGSTGQTELSRIRLGYLPCIVPPRKLQARFGVTVEDLLERLSCSECESESLAALRHALLPKLISGELRVRDAERIATGVVA